MGNKDNSCKDVKSDFQISEDFDKIFEMQKKLQTRLGYDFDNMSLEKITSFWLFNSHAFSDEVSEMFDALGGINDGIGNAVWKKWKKKNTETGNMVISDLSDNDLIELKFEIVDAFHFFINFGISIGMSGSELFSMYIAKNAENHKRQDEGY